MEYVWRMLPLGWRATYSCHELQKARMLGGQMCVGCDNRVLVRASDNMNLLATRTTVVERKSSRLQHCRALVCGVDCSEGFVEGAHSSHSTRNVSHRTDEGLKRSVPVC